MESLSSEISPPSPPPLPLPSFTTERTPGIAIALGLIVLYFVLQMAAGLLLAVVIGLVEGLGPPDRSHFRAAVQTLMQQPAMQTILVMGSLGLAATSVFLLAWRKWPRLCVQGQPPGFGFTRPSQYSFLLLAVLAGLAAPVLGGLLTQWFAQGHPVTQDIQQLGGRTPLGLRIPLVLLVISVGPVVEELLFRGVLLSALLQRWRAVPSVLISSLLFALAHLSGLQFEWFALPQLILLALLLAWLRLRSGSIWPAVVAHGTNNLLAVAVWFVAVKP
ncbi:MAG: CPBP family intramembrane metalloprotease [Pseudomonadota bacterium]|nr:CPBP family intramembrane metalloprotease [Pseudomonadota bacterium]